MFVLNQAEGHILAEAQGTAYGLPIYAVIPHGGKTKRFTGETAYHDAQRLFYDLVVQSTYQK
jgi:hypothetical protein